MRRALAAALIAAALALVPSVASAKPYGYVGQGRLPASNHAHAVRINGQWVVFRTSFASPVVLSKATRPAEPSRPAKSH
jgi:hypothetical protein